MEVYSDILNQIIAGLILYALLHRNTGECGNPPRIRKVHTRRTKSGNRR